MPTVKPAIPGKSIVIQKVQPAACLVCKTTDVQYSITYQDLEKSNDWHNGPADSAYSCGGHLLEVTHIIFKRNGLVNGKGETK